MAVSKKGFDSLTKPQLIRQMNRLIQRVDGWQNLLTGKGVTGVDKRNSTEFAANQMIPHQTLDALYRHDGLARRIIELPIDDMVRNWFKVEGDPDNLIVEALNNVHTLPMLKSALRWGDLYGGSLVVLGLDDGGEFDTPFNPASFKALRFMRVHDRWEVDWSSDMLYNNPMHEQFGQPEFYNITNATTAINYRVHESRTIRFDGAELPDRVRLSNNGWGDSVLTAYYERLRGLSDSYGDLESIIGEFIIGILTIEGLQDMIATGQEKLVKDRLNLIDLSKHIINTILLDSEEKMERVSASVTGIEKLIEKLEGALCAVTGIPYVLLFGEQSQGLGGGAAGSIRLYYDDVSSRQEQELRKPCEHLVRLVQLGSEGPTKGKELEGWAVTFNPLWQPTQEEVVKTRYAQAQTDEIYINSGVLTSMEVTASRFGGESYSYDTDIDEARLTAPPVVADPEDKE